jgi:hypothetical protein
MVDVPQDRIDDIIALIRQHHSDAEPFGVEPTIPAFP